MNVNRPFMKKLSLLLLTGLASLSLSAQLKKTISCPAFTVDLLRGRVGSQLLCTSTVGQIKTAYPCFTTAEDESATAKCGGGVFYKDKDIYFYTARNYIEIGPAFKGQLSQPLMGLARSSTFRYLGNAKVKDVNWDAFATAYGILILYYNKAGKVNKIQLSTEGTDTIQLCE